MRILALGAVGVVAAAACSQQAKPKSSVSASPTVNPAALLAAWKACGSDMVPPANVLASPKLPVKVDVSKTNGAVSQAEANRWASAFLREQQIEGWAITTNRDGLIKGGCLGSTKSYDNIFAPEVGTMNQAKAAGGHLAYEPAATLVAINVVPSSSSAQQFVTGLSGENPPFALAVTYHGPLAAYIVDSSGRKLQELGHTGAGVTFEQAVFGEYIDSQIGSIWFQLATGDCRSAWMGGTCNA
jgi:hypothetical protein